VLKKLLGGLILENREYTSIDLFSGPGGLATGFRWAGIHALIAVEWSDNTVLTYSHSHDADVLPLEEYLESPKKFSHLFAPSDKTLMIHGDIRKVKKPLLKMILKKRFNVESVDIVTGGAPCESFSLAGDRKEDDERNELYTNVVRIARDVDSKMFLFENVKGLFSKKLDGKVGKMYQAICDDFEADKKGRPSFKLASREPKTVCLKAVDYGVPQLRERILLVGINKRYDSSLFNYPEPTHGPNRKYPYVTVEEAIMDLPQVDMDMDATAYRVNPNFHVNTPQQKLFLSFMRGKNTMAPEKIGFNSRYIRDHKGPGHIDKMLQRIKLIKQGEGMGAAFDRLQKEGREEEVRQFFPNKIYASRNRRLELGKPSFTVTGHCLDEMVHPIMDRGLTPREVARLQSFPDWYQIEGPWVQFHGDFAQDKYEQIGDAIPPLLGFALGKEVVKALDKMCK